MQRIALLLFVSFLLTSIHLFSQANIETGSYFTAPPENPLQAPVVEKLNLPKMSGKYVIWGSLGRDARGHIWFGASGGETVPSGQLFEYDPANDVVHPRGDVIAELKRLGLYRDGMGQEKIHSRIMLANDGYLYFTSMDEAGEDWQSGANPVWASHLWRLKPGVNQWEHLFAAPQGLIAMSTGGRYVYALGYYNHVLYQYDTQNNTSRSVTVGAVGGHVSRNILSDQRGHVYVPRLKVDPIEDEVVAFLVEYDVNLNELAETPLDYYREDTPVESHGIIGITYMKDQSMIFVTGRGHLYRVYPNNTGPATVKALGWFHPKGRAYTPAMFTFSGERYLLGIAKKRPSYEWIVYDLMTDSATAQPLPLPEGTQTINVYGSIVKDNDGAFYLAGSCQNPKNYSISNDNLSLLEADGLPEELITQVAELKGEIFSNKKQFVRKLNRTISYKYVKKFRGKIAKRARDKQRYPLVMKVRVGGQ